LVTDLETKYALGQPELHVVPDRAKAASHGVSIAGIAQAVNAMIGGVLAGTYETGGHRYDIRLKLDDSKEDPQFNSRG